jgi:hypothetical protein
MRIPADEVQALISSASHSHNRRRPKHPSIDRMVRALRSSMRKSIDENLQAPIVLLDEAILFVIAFERYQYTQVNSFPFALQLTRVRGDLLSIRELIFLGQESAALAVARVFIEDIELAMGIVVEPEFALAYSDTEKDENKFWKDKVGYGKIYPLVQRFIERGGGNEEEVAAKLEFHRAMKNFLSDHIHPTFYSAFRTAFPVALKNPGMFVDRPLGILGEHFWPLCLFLAEEIQMFAACCINMFIRPDPPAALAGYIPNRELDDALAAAHILQELSKKYVDKLHEVYDVAKATWNISLDDDHDEV